jgi:Protein of unknown function (DUF2752)
MRAAILSSFPNNRVVHWSGGRKKPLVICGLGFGLVFLSGFLQSPPLPFDTCLFKIVTGLPCPSCGMTHSFISLGHGHVREAFFYNLMGPFVYFSLLVILSISIYELFSGKYVLSILWKRYQGGILVAVLFLALASWIWNFYKIV